MNRAAMMRHHYAHGMLRSRRAEEDGAALDREALLAALETLGAAVVVTDAAGRVRCETSEASRILSARDGLSIDSGGILRGLRADARMPPAFRVARGADRPPLSILVGQVAGAAAFIIVDPARRPGPHAAELLQALFSLTPAEARVAALVARGRTPKDAARELGVQVATVRTQLKSVFVKLGVDRQADLIRLVLTTA